MYKEKIRQVLNRMMEHERAVPRRVHHFLKVYSFAKFIAEAEGVDEHTMFIIETVALMHDIGIRPSIIKYGSSAGNYQEQEGPLPARIILEEIGYEEEDIQRICYLIAHHHTYTEIDGIDYQILVEADFLVNIYEDLHNPEMVSSIKEKIFQTEQGTKFLEDMYLSGIEWQEN